MTRSLRPIAVAVSLAAGFSFALALPVAVAPAQSAAPATSPAASSSDLTLTQTMSGNVTTSTWTAPDGTPVWQNTFTVNSDGSTTWVSNYYATKSDYTNKTPTLTKTITADAKGNITQISIVPPPKPATPQQGTPNPSGSSKGSKTSSKTTPRGKITVTVTPHNAGSFGGAFGNAVFGSADYTVTVEPSQGNPVIVEQGEIFGSTNQSALEVGEGKSDGIIDHWANATWSSASGTSTFHTGFDAGGQVYIINGGVFANGETVTQFVWFPDFGKTTALTPLLFAPSPPSVAPGGSPTVQNSSAPTIGAPIDATVTTKVGADGHLGLDITYTIPTIKTGEGSPATSPTSLPAEFKTYLLDILLRTPPYTKFSDFGMMTSGPSSLGAVNPAVTSTTTGTLHSSECLPLGGSTIFCGVPVTQSAPSGASGATNQITVYLPTPLAGTQINELHMDLSAALIGTNQGGSPVVLPLNPTIPGGPAQGTSTQFIGITLVPGPNGTMQGVLTPSKGSQDPFDLSELLVSNHFPFIPYELEFYTGIVPSKTGNQEAPNPTESTNSASASGPSSMPAAPPAPPSTSFNTVTTPGQYFDPVTGGTGIFTTGETVPSTWKPLLPVSMPPSVAPGSTVSFSTEQVSYADPATGQVQYVNTGAPPPAGLTRLLPLSPMTPILPPSFTPAPTPATTNQINTTSQASTDGSGWHSEQDTNSASGVIEGRVYDTNKNQRDDKIDQFADYNGKKIRTASYLWGFDSKGNVAYTVGLKFDVRGDLIFSDQTNFDRRGVLTYEEIADYRPTGYESRDWSFGTQKWSYTFHSYKLPAAPGSSAPAQTAVTPTNTSIGVLLARDYHPGDTITGSLGLPSYTGNYKPLPGLSENEFPIQTYTLPDGTPEWSRFKIGIRGYGDTPAYANGNFSVHLSEDLKGAPDFEVVQIDPLPNLGPSSATFKAADPVPAAPLPSDLVPASATTQLNYWTEEHLIYLWNEAYDVKSWLESATSAEKVDWDDVAYAEDYLYYLYGEIDYVEDDLPASAVASLAHNLANDARSYQTSLSSQPTLTSEDQENLTDSRGWTSFLGGEELYATSWGLSTPTLQFFWTSPGLVPGKLGFMGGSFPHDPLDTQLLIDDNPIWPVAATPTKSYFLWPSNLTSDLHYCHVYSPHFGETVFPVAGITLTGSIANPNLHKGMTTIYDIHLRVTGLYDAAWRRSFDATDIYNDSASIAAHSGSPGPITGGHVTYSLRNMSKDIVTSPDKFRILYKPDFTQGEFEDTGTIHAIRDGGFSLVTEAELHFSPQVGLGLAPGAKSPVERLFRTAWFPSFNLNDPAAFSSSPFMTSCTAGATVPAATTPGATTPTATTSATPTTTPTTTAPTIPTTTTPSTSATNPSGCPSAALTDLYNDAIGNSTAVPGSSNLTTSEIEAAKSRLDEADAKLSKANGAVNDARRDENRAFDTGVSHLSSPLQTALEDKEKAFSQAQHEASDAIRKSEENPTVKGYATAASTLQRVAGYAEMELSAYKQYLIINKFSTEDREALKKAQDARVKAEKARSDAKMEFRDAENALGKLTQSATTK